MLENASDKQAFLNEEGALVWPVMLLYPEYDQSDFIAQFCDVNTFEDQFYVMFGDRVVWDRKYLYRPGNLDVFFEYVDEKGNNYLYKGMDNGLMCCISCMMWSILRDEFQYCGIILNLSLSLFLVVDCCTVDANSTLLQALQHETYIVTGGIPQFVVLPKDSPYRDLYFSRYKAVR